MSANSKRRSFIKKLALGSAGAMVAPVGILQASGLQVEPTKGDPESAASANEEKRKYNSLYHGSYLNRLAFPIGGIGAGMFCLEGTGAISHMSVRNKPEIYHEPGMFAAIYVKGFKNAAKVIEGPVPQWKFFGQPGTGNGAAGATFGLPRFRESEFKVEFPFGNIKMHDHDLPLVIQLCGWSPFIPTDQDNSSLPVGALEYEFTTQGVTPLEAVFSYNAKNFLAKNDDAKNHIDSMKNGFVLVQDGTADKPFLEGRFAIFTDSQNTVVDYCWFRGGWWDPVTMAWNNIKDGKLPSTEPVDKNAPGASLYVPFSLLPGQSKKIRVLMSWYVPESNLEVGTPTPDEKKNCDPLQGCCAGPADLGVGQGRQSASLHYKPWYASRFTGLQEVIEYWFKNYEHLKEHSKLFKDAFYSSTVPAEVIEAVAANLSIIKSPTVLRQYDGRLWSWEGCGDDEGCCHGSCTHVWNYAQAIPHLFPELERTLRNTEFCENQNMEGHQGFRANIPITPVKHDFHAAADGQLGGIMKVYRDWRISGDSTWLSRIFPMVKKSMDYCIRTWDPRGKGIIEEPHHNTYDIEFWGPDGMCTSFYLGALKSMMEMGTFLGKDISSYNTLYTKGKQFIETALWDGEYFIQQIEFKGLNAPDPAKAVSYGGEYSAEAVAMLQKEGPKYQYGLGCLSDGILGAWIAQMCGLEILLTLQRSIVICIQFINTT